MHTLTTLEQAKETIRSHVLKQFGFSPPVSSSARQILHRPFPSQGDQHIINADATLYRYPEGASLRMSLLVEALRSRQDINIHLPESLYTTFGGEATKEEFGGLDSAIALAVTFAGVATWITITNYHLYEMKNGKQQVARILGQKVLGPSMIMARRPSTDMSPTHNGSKHFPDSPVGSRFEWTPLLDVDPQIAELETGLDYRRLTGVS